MDSQANTHATAAAAPLEMGHLQHQQETSSSSSSSHPVAPPPEPVLSEGAPNPDQTTDYLSQPTRLLQVDEGTDPLPPTPLEMPAPALVRQETNEPIGPSTDLPTPMPSSLPSAQPSGPIITINLLLSSTGTRHPYRIDHKYLSKRGVTAENDAGDFDPFVISVYTLKELIWRDWREGRFSTSHPHLYVSATEYTLLEWEPRPSSPSAIRLIHFGRFLDDKLPLKGIIPSAVFTPAAFKRLIGLCN